MGAVLTLLKLLVVALVAVLGSFLLIIFLGSLVREWRLERKRQLPKPRIDVAPMDFCPGCKKGIDPDWCWCGDAVASHGYGSGHSPVEMGCTCHYGDKS